MDVVVDGRRVHLGTGGAPFDPANSCVVFIHGAGLDHTIWALSARYFGQQGRGVLAVDLPGHGLSEGPPLTTIEAMADWLLRLLDTAGATTARLVGFSMGAAVALETAARGGGRIEAMALAGAADEMRVHPDLLAHAEANDHRALELMTSWCYGRTGHMGGQPMPGLWVMGGALRMLERASPGVLFTDLAACAAYAGAIAAAERVGCPALVIVGEADIMTPPRGAYAIANALADAETVAFPGCGHMVMAERPNETLDALRRIV